MVVEAAERSGTLITARLAAEQGRDVFAVPGHPLDPRAAGTNRLLKDGAAIVTSVDDILAGLAPFDLTGRGFHDSRASFDTAASLPAGDHRVADASVSDDMLEPAGDARARVVAALGPAPIPLDDLVRASGVPISIVNAIVLELSVAGRIEHHGGQLVSLKPAPAER